MRRPMLRRAAGRADIFAVFYTYSGDCASWRLVDGANVSEFGRQSSSRRGATRGDPTGRCEKGVTSVPILFQGFWNN